MVLTAHTAPTSDHAAHVGVSVGDTRRNAQWPQPHTHAHNSAWSSLSDVNTYVHAGTDYVVGHHLLSVAASSAEKRRFLAVPPA